MFPRLVLFSPSFPISKFLRILAFLLVGGIAVFLRLRSYEPFKQVGFDETIYRQYVDFLGKNGLKAYPQLIERYNDEQQISPIALLPPTRVSFLVAATGWRAVFGGDSVEALRRISAWSSVLVLLGSAIFAWRWGGARAAFGVFALMAIAPTQLSMAHRALIDGFFAMTALLVIWSLWETLQQSAKNRWLWIYGASLAAMVITKENAAFVAIAVVAILGLNRWLRFGQITGRLLAATFLGPLFGALILVLCAGGIKPLVTVFTVNTTMSRNLAYAAATGDGPWFRYLTDLLLVSPAVLIFAIGGAFQIRKEDKLSLFLLTFIAVSYVAMANVTYGMNLRYANMWDFPLRWLAVWPVLRWSEKCATPTRARWFFYGFLALLTLFEFANYVRIFLNNEMYDPVTIQLMRALKMLR